MYDDENLEACLTGCVPTSAWWCSTSTTTGCDATSSSARERTAACTACSRSRSSGDCGIVVGGMAPARGETEEDVRRVFHAAGTALSVPVWYGFPAGHVGRNVALPFGVRARVDSRGRLFLLESPVEPS